LITPVIEWFDPLHVWTYDIGLEFEVFLESHIFYVLVIFILYMR
jgi:hypothetical protein